MQKLHFHILVEYFGVWKQWYSRNLNISDRPRLG